MKTCAPYPYIATPLQYYTTIPVHRHTATVLHHYTATIICPTPLLPNTTHVP
jgi:hypothetical protein